MKIKNMFLIGALFLCSSISAQSNYEKHDAKVLLFLILTNFCLSFF